MRTIRGLNGYFKLKNARSMSTKNTSSKSSSAFNFFLAIGLLAGGGAYVYRRTRGAGKTEDNVSVDTSSHETDKNTLNLWKRLKSFFLSLHEPAFEKLLPERVLDPRHPRPYTLVIDLDKFLVCHVWDPDHGRWRIAKRPGADLFLFYAAQLYEVVVFSSLPQHEGDAIVKKLDPYGCISYSLYRFATRYKNGIYQKDISLLNRNLEKVIVIGVDTAGFASHPQNMIPVNPWDARLEKSSAESTDFSVLEEMVDFLEMLAFSKRDDIRPVVQKYRKMHEDGSKFLFISFSFLSQSSN